MSNTDTLVSVIDGVCQQDPERWRQFDAHLPADPPGLPAEARAEGFEANDVVQDVFVKLLGKIHTYDRAKCRFRTWLFSVAHHTLIDHARRRASHKKALDGWVANMLQASPSDSVRMEREWTGSTASGS